MDPGIRAIVYRCVPAPLRQWLARRYYVDRVRSVPLAEPEAAFLGHFVHEGDVVADIGANFGWYTYELSRLVGRGGIVHSFEPVRTTADILGHVVRKLGLGNVRVHPCALADHDGPASMDVPRDGSGAQNFYLARLNPDASAGTSATTMRSLDSLRSQGMEQCAFLKCDVEGAEMLVMKGAETVLATDRPAILCEVCGHGAHFGYAPRDIFGYLGDRRYRAFRVEGGRLLPASEHVAEAINYFFVPEERLAGVAGPRS